MDGRLNGRGRGRNVHWPQGDHSRAQGAVVAVGHSWSDLHRRGANALRLHSAELQQQGDSGGEARQAAPARSAPRPARLLLMVRHQWAHTLSCCSLKRVTAAPSASVLNPRRRALDCCSVQESRAAHVLLSRSCVQVAPPPPDEAGSAKASRGTKTGQVPITAFPIGTDSIARVACFTEQHLHQFATSASAAAGPGAVRGGQRRVALPLSFWKVLSCLLVVTPLKPQNAAAAA